MIFKTFSTPERIQLRSKDIQLTAYTVKDLAALSQYVN